jgi:hypothetical protein
MKHSASHRPADASEVVEIVGPMDDSVVDKIIATRANPAEVAEAYGWLSARDYFHRAAHDAAQGRVAQVYQILAAERRSAEAS